MHDTPRRLLLRVILKLLALFALLTTLYFLFDSANEATREASNTPILRVDLTSIPMMQPHRLEWAGGAIQILRTRENEEPHLFFDRGGNLNCPLSWQSAGNTRAPQQPWPGGFRDQCSGIWYRYDGQIVPGQSHTTNLQSPPYKLIDKHLLEIGVNGDNAPLAR